jgi:hypothetical protein
MTIKGRCDFTVFHCKTCDLCDPILEGTPRDVVMLGPWAGGGGVPQFLCRACIEEALKALRGLVRNPPHICPVCFGTGQVDAGFYASTSGQFFSTGGTEPCRSCKGSGVVWEVPRWPSSGP